MAYEHRQPRQGRHPESPSHRNLARAVLKVDRVDEIAAVDGVHVLFVGPMDLSVSLGVIEQFDHPTMRTAFAKVVEASRKTKKVARLLL